MDPNEKIILRIREDILTKPIEVNIESTGIAKEDTTDQHETREKELWKRKKETRKAIPNDAPVIRVSCYCSNDLHKDKTIVKIADLTEPSRILKEQESDPTLLKFKSKMLDRLFGEQILKMMHVTCNVPETKSVTSSKMMYSVNNTIMILVKIVTCRSFCLDNRSKCYYNQYMEQVANRQAFSK